jgi:hypothetical protein
VNRGTIIRIGARAYSAVLLCAGCLFAQPFDPAPRPPVIDRWMYPFNSTPGSRPVAGVFSTFGDESGVDTRHGQFVLAWDTAPAIPAGWPPHHYLVRSARVSVTVSRGEVFVNDSTPDAHATYRFPDDPEHQPDLDPGRPLELFGTGFRNGFGPFSFLANSPFGGAATGRRNAFAAGFSPAGELVDVGSNLGKTNVDFPTFPSRPFAFGQINDVPAGELVPAGSRIVFEIDLGDPLTLGYVRSGLARGRLWFTITWLGGSEGFVGAPTFPELATAENLIHPGPTLELVGTSVRPADTDDDGLPDEWKTFHFADTATSPVADPDADGTSNAAEWIEGTNPNQPDTLRVHQRLEPDGALSLGWIPLANHVDIVESSTDLIHWTSASGTPDHRTRGWVQWTPATPTNHDLQLYRVRRTRPSP